MTASEETKTVTQLSSDYTQGRQGVAMEKKIYENKRSNFLKFYRNRFHCE